MTLLDIYNQLAYGELRMLTIGGSSVNTETDGIKPEDYKRLLPHVQLGLTVLHTRCALKESSVLIPLALPRVTYTVAKKQDTPTGWADDLLMIERVHGIYQGEEVELPIDDLTEPASIMKLAANRIIIPSDAPWLAETTVLDVKYRANHPAINPYIANAAPLAVPIDLPYTHLEALCYFVASRLHNPIGMTPGAMHEGNNYATKFEAAVAQLNDLGMHRSVSGMSNQFEAKGFV